LKLKTYRAWTMAEALTFVKADLGSDAVILHTRTFDRGGFLGFGKRTVVEITAGRAADMPREAESSAEGRAATARADARRAAVPAGQVVRQSVASRAYGETRPAERTVERTAERTVERTVPEAPAAGAPVDQAADREKTRRLALAMSIQLEKQADVRDAAAQNERATQEAAAQRADAAAKSSLKPPAKAVAGGFASATAAAPPATQPTHPAPPSSAAAQRFVLVAQPVGIGNGNGDGKASGLERLASVVAPADVRAAAPAPVPASITDSESQAAAPSLAWPLGADAYGFDGGAPWPPSAPGIPSRVASSTPTARETVGESVARASSFAESEPVRARHTEPQAGAARAALDELAEISDFVGRVLRDGTAAPSVEASRAQGRMPRETQPAAASTGVPTVQQPLAALLEPHYARLIEQEVADELARRVLDLVAAELADAIDAGATPSERVVREAIERRIAAILPSDDSDGLIGRLMMGGRLAGPALSAGAPRKVAFVGPTGVGKTTTLAKIAAQLKLKRGLRVGIVAADTYRIAAVEQLRTYAAILELPVEVASSPAEAAAACDRLAGQGIEIILIDTAGRSQNDRMKLSELRAFLAAAAPDETHLVLSATAGERTLAREAESFGKVGVDRIVLTKLDEAASFGTLINLVERLGKRVSLFTNGQEVPDHIEFGRGRRLAELVMGSEVR
jgi:flagellar biosynthesis protein FlhF